MSKKYFRLLFAVLFLAVWGQGNAAFKDIKVDLTNGNLLESDEISAKSSVKFGIQIADDGTAKRVAADSSDANIVVSGQYHSDEHGWGNFSSTVKVEGPVKISMGTCAWGGDVKVTDANGTEIVKFTSNNGQCYHNNKAENIASAYYNGEPATLTISGGNYTPYIAVESVDPSQIPTANEITFDLGGQTPDGKLPEAAKVEAGKDYTLPLNRTLYIAGKTLTGWSDGSTVYKPGEKIVPEKSMTFTPVFADNTVALDDRKGNVTLMFDFQRVNGAPTLSEQNTIGIYVTQVDVNGEVIDVKLDFDTNNGGKLANGSWTDWAQMNSGTKFIVPSCKGAEITIEAYNNLSTTSIGGKTNYEPGKTVTVKITDPAETAEIIIGGDGSYYRYIAVALPVATPKDVTATWDFSDKAVMDAIVALSGSEGTVSAVENNGVMLTVVSNGTSFRNNGNNIQIRKGAEFRVPVKTSEDIVTVRPYPGYSYFCFNNGDEIQNTQANENETVNYKAKNADVERGYVSVISTNDNNYFYGLSVLQKAPKQLLVLDNAAATATFPFSDGTDGQKANVSNADYFLGSKVNYGGHLAVYDANSGQTRFQPNTQDIEASDDNAISFIITPKFGLSFTPTKVAVKTTRFGTDMGLLDIAWMNPDGTKVALATEVKPQRNNASPNVSDLSYEVSGATPGEGACGLVINLYSLSTNKQIGFADIVIEGTLSGTEKEVPMLASFKANGVEYAADEVFEADNGNYVTTIEVASKEPMISAANPVTDVTPAGGEVGEITYEGDDTKCVATIPVRLGEITINYIANFVRKPFFLLTYYDTDAATVLGTQSVEKDETIKQFDVDFTTAQAKEGYKVRGWFAAPELGRKISLDDVITRDLALYAVASEIEESSTHRKYTFDLTQEYFYPEDHEAFNVEGTGHYYNNHGWAFENGDKIQVLVGPKATVALGVCRYGHSGNYVVTDPDGNPVEATIPTMSPDEVDGDIFAFNYEGKPGLLTLAIECSGQIYLHNVKITNTSEVNYEKDGSWMFVKQGDARSLLDVLEAANTINASKDAERLYVFIPDGVYDLEQICLTPLSGHNISLIGQSMAGTIIKNAPLTKNEGIGKTATILNTGSNNYMQDLTLQNAMQYYEAMSAGQGAGRAVVLQDKGTNTICKNVTMLSYQDTYYTNNPNGKYYWETSDIHGTVDFICGEGTLFMEKSTLTVEMRNADGKGECTLTAPSTSAGKAHGYVFSNCTIQNHAEKYNFGRAWSNEPRCAYINTTFSDDKLNSARWTAGGMNVAAKAFVEFNSKDANGNVVSPASHVMTFTKGNDSNTMETILTADQAADYAVEKVFTDWAPATLTVQVAAPAAELKDGKITWTPSEDAVAYAIFNKEGELLTITTENSYNLPKADNDVFVIRAANKMGGLGEGAEISATSGLENIEAAEIISSVYYNVQGMKVDSNYKGLVIRVDTLCDGSTVTTKTVNR